VLYKTTKAESTQKSPSVYITTYSAQSSLQATSAGDIISTLPRNAARAKLSELESWNLAISARW